MKILAFSLTRNQIAETAILHQNPISLHQIIIKKTQKIPSFQEAQAAAITNICIKEKWREEEAEQRRHNTSNRAQEQNNEKQSKQQKTENQN